jgi:hypothetical protein
MDHFPAIAAAVELVANETFSRLMTRAVCSRAAGSEQPFDANFN